MKKKLISFIIPLLFTLNLFAGLDMSSPNTSSPNGTVIVPTGSFTALSFNLTVSKPHSQIVPGGTFYFYAVKADGQTKTTLDHVDLVFGTDAWTTSSDGKTDTYTYLSGCNVYSSNVDDNYGTIYCEFFDQNNQSMGTSQSYPIQVTISSNNICCDKLIITSGIPGSFSGVSPCLGGSGVYFYQWQSSNDNLTFTDISGANGPGYSNNASITQTVYYRRIVTSGEVPSSYSNSVKVSVYKVTTGTINPLQYCTGTPVSIPFTTSLNANSGNTFTAQLSDGSGSFASPYILGTINSISSGTIAGTIPNFASPGTGYKVRVIGSDPVVTGTVSNAITIIANTITTGTISPLKYCPGASISIPYTTCGYFNTTNTFTVQMSDENGSFATPITLGSITSSTSGTIATTLPAVLVESSNYRVRVVSSSPVIIGTINNSDIMIRNLINNYELASFCMGVTGASVPYSVCTPYNSGNSFTA